MSRNRDLLKGWIVLVVEDQADSREVAERILRYYGATVYCTTNGIEALDMLESVVPRFILSDLSMPDMDGWTLIRRLRSDPRTTAIPVIALTAHAMAGDRERVIDAGFDHYITKPLTAQTFIEHLYDSLKSIPTLGAELGALNG